MTPPTVTVAEVAVTVAEGLKPVKNR